MIHFSISKIDLWYISGRIFGLMIHFRTDLWYISAFCRRFGRDLWYISATYDTFQNCSFHGVSRINSLYQQPITAPLWSKQFFKRESSLPLERWLVVVEVCITFYYYYYYYLKTTFINPYKGDFAETISPDSDYKIEDKKRTPAKSISYFPSEPHSLSGWFSTETFLYLRFQ